LHVETISTFRQALFCENRNNIETARLFPHSRAMQNPIGRPQEYTDADILAALDRHAAGESLVHVGRSPGMPSFQAIVERCENNPDLARRLLSAREEYAHAQVEEAQRIADQDVDAPRARNRIHIRTWKAERFARQTFGPKVELNVTGSVSVGAALEEARRRVRPISDLTQAHDPHVIDLQAETVSEATDSQSAQGDIDPLS
jgi:hypothetical protein